MRVLALSILMSVGLMACGGHASVWEQHEQGGTLSLVGNEEDAEKDAHKQAARHCGGPGSYRIVRKERVVVGQADVEQISSATETQSKGVKHEDYSRFGNTEHKRRERNTQAHSTRTRTVQDVTELRVSYECKTPAY